MRKGRKYPSNLNGSSELQRDLKRWIREELEQARRTNRIKEAVEWSSEWMEELVDSLMTRMPDYFSWADERLLRSQEHMIKKALQMLIRELYEMEYEENKKIKRNRGYPLNCCGQWEVCCGCGCCRCMCCGPNGNESPHYLRSRNAMLRGQLSSMFETENRMLILELLAKSVKEERLYRSPHRRRGTRLLY